MDQKEVAKDIVIVALQQGYIARNNDSEKNAERIGNFYKTIYNAVLNARDSQTE